jgi:type IX secretion system PorP/SprF family membrane protein
MKNRIYKFNPFGILLLISMLMPAHEAISQLPVFTQFSQNQLNINPALAGFIDDDFKFNALHRSQSYSRLVTSTFSNASFQMRPLLDFLPSNDVFGFGVNAFTHKTLDVYSHQAMSATISYSKGLNYDGSKSLTFGFQGRYNSKRIDYTRLLFPNQFDFSGYTSQLPNNEPIQVINANFFDINSGVLFNAVGENESFTVGFSMYNINQSSQDPLKLATKEGLTYNYQIGYSKVLSNYSQVFFGGLHSIRARQSSTSLVGAIQILPDYDKFMGFDVGGVYVLNNSISPFVNLNMNMFKASFTYNFSIAPNISYMQNANAFEIGLQLLFSRPSEDNTITKRQMSCFK